MGLPVARECAAPGCTQVKLWQEGGINFTAAECFSKPLPDAPQVSAGEAVRTGIRPPPVAQHQPPPPSRRLQRSPLLLGAKHGGGVCGAQNSRTMIHESARCWSLIGSNPLRAPSKQMLPLPLCLPLPYSPRSCGPAAWRTSASRCWLSWQMCPTDRASGTRAQQEGTAAEAAAPRPAGWLVCSSQACPVPRPVLAGRAGSPASALSRPRLPSLPGALRMEQQMTLIKCLPLLPEHLPALLPLQQCPLTLPTTAPFPAAV